MSGDFCATIWRREWRRAMEKMMLMREKKSEQEKMGIWDEDLIFFRLTFWGQNMLRFSHV